MHTAVRRLLLCLSYRAVVCTLPDTRDSHVLWGHFCGEMHSTALINNRSLSLNPSGAHHQTTSKLSRNIQVQRIAYCSLVVWLFQHLEPTKNLRHRESGENQAGQIQAPETVQSCQREPGIPDPVFPIPSPVPAGTAAVGTAGTQPMSLAVLHQMQRLPPAHGWTTQPNATAISHTSKPPPTMQGVLSLGGRVGGQGAESSHLLTILLSLLACGIVESSPFTLILVGDCTLRCSGSMDCWQVDMGV